MLRRLERPGRDARTDHLHCVKGVGESGHPVGLLELVRFVADGLVGMRLSGVSGARRPDGR
jgi:hypothetical protein